MNDQINKVAKKVSELYARLLQKRYIEIRANGKLKNVWCSRYTGIAY